MGLLQSTFIGQMLQAIFYGLHCVIFLQYLRIQYQRKHEPKGLLIYALGLNFILCTAYLVVGIPEFLQRLPGPDPLGRIHVLLVGVLDTLYASIDFISQGIWIYRCWIMWRQVSIVIVPVLLSLACLGTALVSLPVFFKYGDESPNWWVAAVVSFFSMSLVVNAVVTGLIVVKIAIVCRSLRVGGFNTRNYYNHARGPRDLYPIISMLMESGMITFVAQLVQAVLWGVDIENGFPVVSGIVVQLYGISPIIVLVRAAMGIAYDNETLMTLPSQAISFAEIRSDNSRTLEVNGNNPVDKRSPSQTVPNPP